MTKTLALILILVGCATAQNEPGTARTAKAPCVILSATEPSTGIATWSREGRARKHMLTYLAGEYPPGVPFRSSLKDKDVDKIKAKGGRVLILDPHYTHEDLDNAKQKCESTSDQAVGK